MQPAAPRPEQDADAVSKLAGFKARTGKKPNIVILLAAEGLKLTSTYSQYTCTPTRAAMYTGRLPVRTGLIRPILARDTLKVNPWEGEKTVAGILSDHGYHTMLVGKWHIGESESMRPYDAGFDEFFGFYKAQKEYTQSSFEHRYPDLVLDADKLSRCEAIGSNNDLIYRLKDGTTETVTTITSPQDIAEADKMLRDCSVRRIAELARGDKPFYLSHSFMKVHADNFPSVEFRGASASKYPYKDALVEVDAYIGDIVLALDAAGGLENTSIFVTSDNGPQMDSWPDGGYTPFRGAKGTT